MIGAKHDWIIIFFFFFFFNLKLSLVLIGARSGETHGGTIKSNDRFWVEISGGSDDDEDDMESDLLRLNDGVNPV